MASGLELYRDLARFAAAYLTHMHDEETHAVGFQVTEDNGYVAPWTDWEDSPVVTFHL